MVPVTEGQGRLNVVADKWNRRVRVSNKDYEHLPKEDAIAFAESHLRKRKDGIGWQLYEAVQIRNNWVDVYFVRELTSF